MRNVVCVLVIGMLNWGNLSAVSDTVVLSISDVEIEVGKSSYDVAITVENFNKLVSFSYTVEWNPAQFEFKDIMGINDNLDLEFNMNITAEGRLPVLWFDVRLDGKTLQEGDTIMSIRYELLEDPCSGEAFTFSDEPTQVTFLDIDNDMPFRVDPGEAHNPLCLSTDVQELSEDSYKMFPNPSFGQVRVKAKQRVEFIEIFDFTGARLASFAGTDTFYYGGTGAYVVRVHTRKGVGQKRVIFW